METSGVALEETSMTDSSGYTGEITWLGVSFVLPNFSTTFYRHAVQRKATSALIFYLLFTSAVVLILTISVARSFISFNEEITEAFQTGSFPEIVIQNGIAYVDAEQPFVLYHDPATLIVFDTTGEITFLDQGSVNQGILLTRNSLHLLSSSGDYQQIPLIDLHEIFNRNPIVINAATIVDYWGQMSSILLVIAFFSLGIWHILLRFFMLILIGLIMWGLTKLVSPEVPFDRVLIVGIYATVPALCCSFILGELGVRFFGLSSLILLAFWTFGLVAGLSTGLGRFFSELRELRAWRGLLGLPLLVVMSVVQIFKPLNGSNAIGVIAALTTALMLVVDFWTYDEAFIPGVEGEDGNGIERGEVTEDADSGASIDL